MRCTACTAALRPRCRAAKRSAATPRKKVCNSSFRQRPSALSRRPDENRVKAVRFQKMELGEPDESGRRRPVPVIGSEFDIEADTIVIAIGYHVEKLIYQTTPRLEATDWGTVKTDEHGRTSIPGHLRRRRQRPRRRPRRHRARGRQEGGGGDGRVPPQRLRGRVAAGFRSAGAAILDRQWACLRVPIEVGDPAAQTLRVRSRRRSIRARRTPCFPASSFRNSASTPYKKSIFELGDGRTGRIGGWSHLGKGRRPAGVHAGDLRKRRHRAASRCRSHLRKWHLSVDPVRQAAGACKQVPSLIDPYRTSHAKS